MSRRDNTHVGRCYILQFTQSYPQSLALLCVALHLPIISVNKQIVVLCIVMGYAFVMLAGNFTLNARLSNGVQCAYAGGHSECGVKTDKLGWFFWLPITYSVSVIRCCVRQRTLRVMNGEVRFVFVKAEGKCKVLFTLNSKLATSWSDSYVAYIRCISSTCLA